jgi:hypothetical protein
MFDVVKHALAVAGDPLIQGAPSSSHASLWGWTVGAGFERALTPAWSVSLEYDSHRFKSTANPPETVDLTPTGPSSKRDRAGSGMASRTQAAFLRAFRGRSGRHPVLSQKWAARRQTS